jgi:hypothetical protein
MTSVDARLVRGDTTSLDLVAAVGGNAINLTALVVRFTAKFDPADTEAVIAKSSETGGVLVTGPEAGAIRVLIDAEDTADLPARPLYLCYDVEVSDAGGHRFTAALGMLELRPDVSA